MARDARGMDAGGEEVAPGRSVEEEMARSGGLSQEHARELLRLNRQLQRQVAAKLEVVQKHQQENHITLRKVQDIYKHLLYKEQEAQGLQVCFHKEKKTLIVPLPEEKVCVEAPATRYFVSKTGTVPKPNADAVKLADFFKKMPLPFTLPDWTEAQRQQLRDLVRGDVAQMKLEQVNVNPTPSTMVDAAMSSLAPAASGDLGKKVRKRDLARQAAERQDEQERDESTLRVLYKRLVTTREETTFTSEEDRRCLDQVDWAKVAKRLGGEHEARECEQQWRFVEDPLVHNNSKKNNKRKNENENKNDGSSGGSKKRGRRGGESSSSQKSVMPEFEMREGQQLMDLARKHDCRDWDQISKELGSGKRPMDCLMYYQRNRKRRNISVNWTEQEDAILEGAVTQLAGSDDWNKWVVVASMLRDKTAKQSRHRWKIILNNREKKAKAAAMAAAVAAGEIPAPSSPPKKKTMAKWTKEEDELLLKAIEEHGFKWVKVATHVPNKVDRQCRERYLNIVNPDLKKTQWTNEEVLQLYNIVVAYARNHEGRINWEYVATNMRRSSDHCRKRWSRSLLTFYKGALKDLVRECCAEMGAEIAELNGTAKGPPKWTLEEEMQLLSTAKEMYVRKDTYAKGGYVNWDKMEGEGKLPPRRDVASCKRKIQFQLQHLLDHLMDHAISDIYVRSVCAEVVQEEATAEAAGEKPNGAAPV